MGALGDLAEALVDAPRLQTLHLRGTHRIDMDVLRRSWEASSEGSSVAMVTLTREGSPRPQDDGFELWFEAGTPSRWRHRWHGDTSIAVGDDVLMSFGDGLVRRDRDQLGTSLPDPFRPMLDGATLFAAFRLDAPTETEVLGRPAWRTTGTRRIVPRPLMWHGYLQGDRVELTVDQATGVVLDHRTFHGDDLLSEVRVEEVDVDQPLDPALFVPEGPVRDAEELHHELRERHVEESVRSGVADHRPSGPPPDDEDGARRAITAVFDCLFEPSQDGEALPAVEHGEDLGRVVADAQRRFGQTEPAECEVREIAFDDDRQATVWFDVILRGAPRLQAVEGRAVRTDAGWRVARSTVAQLLVMAGIHLPPGPESPGDAG